MSIYGFRQGPTYRGQTRDSFWSAAFEQPMSAWDTFWDQAKGGVLESFGLGTVIRENIVPPLADGRPIERVGPYFRLRTPAEQAEASLANALTEDQYKTSPYFRADIPWDRGMTEDRAAALAMLDDAKKVRQYYAEKRPITSFFGNLAGQAIDPINYVPMAGPAVKAAAVARFGKVAGAAATGTVDAAANTAVFGLATASGRAQFGDDVSWQAIVSEVATAALIGSAFGGISGAFGARIDARNARQQVLRGVASDKLRTLKATQEARVALNEAVTGMALDGEVRLSPNAIDPIQQAAAAIVPDVVRQSSDIAVPSRDSAAPISGLEEALNNLRSGRNIVVSAKKPVIDMLKRMGGVDPDSPLGAELKALGITSKSAPGLYRRQPMRVATEQGVVETMPLRALDNVPAGEVAERFVGRGIDNNGYVSQQAWIDAIDAEVRGEPWLTPDEQRRYDDIRRPVEDLDEFMNRFGVDYEGRTNAEVMADIRKIEASLSSRTPDAQYAASDDGLGEAGIAEWTGSNRRADDAGTMSATYRVDPETGSYLEEAEIRQLDQEGRLSEGDRAILAAGDTMFTNGTAYGRALEAAVTCLL